MAVMTTTQFVDLYSKDFDSIFKDEYNRQPEEALRVLKPITMDGAYDRGGEVVGLGSMAQIDEGNAYPYDAFLPGREKTITPKEYALGVQVSRIMFEDDRTGFMKQGMAELGKSAAYTRELLGWDVFNSGFVTTYRTGIDSLALFTASHTRIDGGTVVSNLATGSLTQSNLQTGINLFETLVNDRGIPIVMKPDLLIVPPALQWKAQELLGSEYQPETGNNAINPVNKLGLKWMVSHYLSSTTAWFLVSQANHKLHWYWRRKLQLEQTTDFNTKHALYTASFRAVPDFRMFRGVVGSTGA